VNTTLESPMMNAANRIFIISITPTALSTMEYSPNEAYTAIAQIIFPIAQMSAETLIILYHCVLKYANTIAAEMDNKSASTNAPRLKCFENFFCFFVCSFISSFLYATHAHTHYARATLTIMTHYQYYTTDNISLSRICMKKDGRGVSFTS